MLLTGWANVHSFNKKGFGFVTKTVVVLVSFLVILAIPMKLQAAANSEEKALAECKFTIGIEQFLGDGLDPANQFDATCRTIIKEFPEKAKTINQFYDELARHMARAWWVTHEGTKENLWAQDGIFASVGRVFSGTEHGCYTIYVLDMFPDRSYGPSLNFTDFRFYLQDTVYIEKYDPELKEDIPYTYWSYIEDYGGRGAIYMPIEGRSLSYNEQTDPAIEYGIRSGRSYAISVVSPSSTPSSKSVKNVVVLSSLEFARTLGCYVSDPLIEDRFQVIA